MANPPTPERKRRAGFAIVGVVLVSVLVIFLLRQAWHADQREEDPQSQAAPDSP